MRCKSDEKLLNAHILNYLQDQSLTNKQDFYQANLQSRRSASWLIGGRQQLTEEELKQSLIVIGSPFLV